MVEAQIEPPRVELAFAQTAARGGRYPNHFLIITLQLLVCQPQPVQIVERAKRAGPLVQGL